MFGKKKDKNSEFSPDIMAFKNALEEVRFTPEVEHDAELINMFHWFIYVFVCLSVCLFSQNKDEQ